MLNDFTTYISQVLSDILNWYGLVRLCGILMSIHEDIYHNILYFMVKNFLVENVRGIKFHN